VQRSPWRRTRVWPRAAVAAAPAHLRDEELGEALGEPALLTGEDHLQHVAVQLLHHHEHLLRSLKHALQVHDAQVTYALRGGGGGGGGWDYTDV